MSAHDRMAAWADLNVVLSRLHFLSDREAEALEVDDYERNWSLSRRRWRWVKRMAEPRVRRAIRMGVNEKEVRDACEAAGWSWYGTWSDYEWKRFMESFDDGADCDKGL